MVLGDSEAPPMHDQLMLTDASSIPNLHQLASVNINPHLRAHVSAGWRFQQCHQCQLLNSLAACQEMQLSWKCQ